MRLGPLILLLLLASPTAAAVTGVVRGGGEHDDLTVVALTTRDLRQPNVIHATAPVAASGDFTVPATRPVYLMVTAGCDPTHSLAACQRFFPHHAPVPPDRAGLVLQVPDLDLVQHLWRGGAPEPGPYRPAGALLVVAALLAATWLRRRPDHAPARPTPHRAGREPWLWAAASVPLLLWNLGTEPLDLLEYSYFHEGVRPPTTWAVLTDFISAELAHGPVMPLILRAAHAISPSPWVLRLPSVLFGVLTIVVTWDLVRRTTTLTTARAAAALALLAPVAAFYARDATPYALTGLCAALTLWLIERARHRPRLWIAFAAVHLVGFFAHYGFAFLSLSEAVALTVCWWRREPRALAGALTAFAAAAVLPTLLAPHLAHMIVASGVRFALMSPVYPESPGLLTFTGTFLTVLAGLPHDAVWALLLVAPLWLIGLRALLARAPILAWLLAAQATFIVLWLLFSHTMSTEVGGGRVFYAFRWTRPLLLGVLLPLAGLALARRARLALVPLLAIAAWQTAALPLTWTRPAQATAAAWITENVRPGDAYAVLPAAFYSDPLQYHLARGAPPDLITAMRERDLPVATGTLRGPLVETTLPLETIVDRLDHRRLWVATYREEMFGVPKFDPGVAERTHAWLDAHYERVERRRFPHLDVTLYRCDTDCAWAGRDHLIIDLADPLQAWRYLAGPAPPGVPLAEPPVTLVLPGDARRATIHGRATVTSDRLASTKRDDGTTVATLTPGEGRTELTLTGAPVRVEVWR